MKTKKTIIAVLCIFTIAAGTAAAESFINEDFSSFGISSIGVYVESYEDERVEDFEAEYSDAYMMQYVNTFRYTLCDYNAVTPKLMTPGYPLAGSGESNDLDELVATGVAFLSEESGWATSLIDDFAGGSLAELRAKAEAEGIDAVLVVRYYPIEYFVPFSGYSSITTGGSSYSTTTTRASVGKLQKGLGLLPALELYDAKSGVRLWYSANWTGNITRAGIEEYDSHIRNAEDLFVEENSVAEGNTLETEAVTNLVVMAMDGHDFPLASDSGTRDESAVAAQSKTSHMFWTDYPEYDRFGTFIGIGYSISYVGDFPIYYRDDDTPYLDADGNPNQGDLAGTAENSILHCLTIPMFAVGTKNIALEPSFYFGFMQPNTTQATYTYMKEDEDEPWIETEETETGNVTVWGVSVGMDLAVKYYLRFTDTVSAFIGGRGLAEMCLITVNPENEAINSYDFGDVVGSLAQIDYFTFNASVLAGLRLDTESPFEFYGMYTPVGLGSNGMVTLGMNWHGAKIGSAPHAKNSDPLMRW